MAALRFTQRAREDLLEIWIGIATHDVQAADRILDRIEQSCRWLRDHPQLGVIRPEIATDARMLVIERWLALYRLIDGGVQVVRVVYGARDLTRLDWPSEKEPSRSIDQAQRKTTSLANAAGSA